MRKSLFFYGLLTVCFIAGTLIKTYAQGKEETFWPNGNPKVLGYYDDKKYKNREWKAWYENGQVKRIENFNRGRLEGLVTEFYDNGQLRFKQRYKPSTDFNGSMMADGLYTEFHPNGEKLMEGNYLNGGKDGAWTYWFANGSLQKQEVIKNRKKEEAYKEWYANGKEKISGAYLNDNKSGNWKEWHENGQLARDENYDANGKLTGLVLSFYANGQKKTEGSYTASTKNGSWKEWHENGQPKISALYENYGLAGLYTEWYDNGGKKLESHYINNKLHGPWLEWFENGKPKTEGKYSHGLRHHTWLTWDTEGNKIKEVEYNTGKKKKEINF